MCLSCKSALAPPTFLIFVNFLLQVPSFEKKHDLWPCMVAPTKIIAGLGLSLGIDILEAPGATGDYRTLLTSKATAMAQALSAPVQPCPRVFVPGEDDPKPGRVDGYDFGFLHIKVVNFLNLSIIIVKMLVILQLTKYNATYQILLSSVMFITFCTSIP